MQGVIYVVISVLISMALSLLLSEINRRNREEIVKNLTEEHIVIRLPRTYFWVGCIDVLGFSTFLFLMSYYDNGTSPAWTKAVFGFFVLIGIWIVIKTQIWKIEIFRSKDYFIYQLAPWRVYSVLYRECEYYRYSRDALVLKTKERTLRIELNATNLAFLTAMLTKNGVSQQK